MVKTLEDRGTESFDYLVSKKLKDKLTLINKRGNTIVYVMPDCDNHLHIQTDSLNEKNEN